MVALFEPHYLVIVFLLQLRYTKVAESRCETMPLLDHPAEP